MRLIVVFLISVHSLFAYADDTVPLTKGQAAPMDGVLFSSDKANQTRKDLIELDELRLKEPSYKRTIDLYKANENLYSDKIKIVSDQNDNLAKNLYEARSLTTWEKLGYFALGVAVTGLAVRGIQQSLK